MEPQRSALDEPGERTGIRTWHGLAGPRIDDDGAAMAFDDDAPCDVQAEAGALADVLGGEEGLEGARGHLRWHPEASVADLDDDSVLFGAGRQAGACRLPSIASMALSMRLVQTWLSSASVSLNRQDVGTVVPHHGDAIAELVAEASPGCSQARP